MQTENTYVETDLGNIALNPRGEYSDEVSYEYLDTVSYKGGSYTCLAELTKTISGIAPAQGENTEHWQMLTLPGQLTPEAVAMHDDVVNKAKQVETSRAAVELSQQEVEAAQADVSQMRQDTQEAAEEAASSRDSAAGYAQSAETSRTAAKESEDNINAQVTGFDTHVAEKTSAAETAITEARRAAVNAVSTKQDDATQAVTDEGDKQIKNVEDAGTEQVDKAKSAGASAVSAAGAAGVSAVNAVKAQQTASIKAVADEGTQQVTAVNTAGSTQISTIETKGADRVKAIQEAGKNALQNISNGVDKGLSEEGKAADAKATGEAISKLTEDLENLAFENSIKLPEGFIPVQCIETDGTANGVILTDIPNNLTRAKLKIGYSLHSNIHNHSQVLLGSKDADGKTIGPYVSADGFIRMAPNSTTFTKHVDDMIQEFTVDYLDLQMYNNEKNVFFPDYKERTSYPLAIFGNNDAGTLTELMGAGGKIYYIKILNYYNDIILLPCIRKNDNQCGFYDICNLKFHVGNVGNTAVGYGLYSSKNELKTQLDRLTNYVEYIVSGKPVAINKFNIDAFCESGLQKGNRYLLSYRNRFANCSYEANDNNNIIKCKANDIIYIRVNLTGTEYVGCRIGIHEIGDEGFINDSGWITNAHKGITFTISHADTRGIRIVFSFSKTDEVVTTENESRDKIYFYNFANRVEIFVNECVGFKKLEQSAADVEKINVMNRKMWITSAHRGFVDSNLHENTLAAFYNAYLNGAKCIETDARMSGDGVLVSSHDSTVTGIDPASGESVTYQIDNTPSTTLNELILSNDLKWGKQTVPTLEQVLNLCYNTGMWINIDMKNGGTYAETITKLVWKCGMRGKVIYALNGTSLSAMQTILQYDPDAKFMNIINHYTDEMYQEVNDYEKKFYAYTSEFDEETIMNIKNKGVMLACISLTTNNFQDAIKWHPEMCEFPHTSNFNEIENDYFETVKLY